MSNGLDGSTGQWVNQVQETQAKDEKNRKRQGDGHPEKKKPGKQHLNGN